MSDQGPVSCEFSPPVFTGCGHLHDPYTTPESLSRSTSNCIAQPKRRQQALAIQPGKLSRRVSEVAPAVPLKEFARVGLSDPGAGYDRFISNCTSRYGTSGRTIPRAPLCRRTKP